MLQGEDPGAERQKQQGDANQDNIREVLKPAKNKGITVIASFVEDASSLSILWQCGVQLIQGNFLQEPSSLMSFTFNEEET